MSLLTKSGRVIRWGTALVLAVSLSQSGAAVGLEWAQEGRPQQPPAQPAPTQDEEEDIIVIGERFISVNGSRNASKIWRRAESEHFIVYSDDSEANLVQQVARLEQFDSLLRLFTGKGAASTVPKFELYSVASVARYSGIAPQPQGFVHSPSHEKVHAFYRAAPSAVVAGLNRGHFAAGDVEDHGDWILHEYVHHFLLQHEPFAVYPTWYVEGVAEYLAAATISGAKIEIGSGRPAFFAYLQNTGFPIDYRKIIADEKWHALLKSPEVDPTPQEFLAQSWLLAHYLLGGGDRTAPTKTFLQEVRESTDPDSAFKRAFGYDIQELSRRLRAHARSPGLGRRFASDYERVSAGVHVARLPASANTLLLLYGAMRAGIPDQATRASAVTRVRGLAPRYDDFFSRRVLAFAEINYGVPAAADGPLQELMVKYQDDVEILYLKGLRHLAEGRSLEGRSRAAAYGEARRWLARAHNLDPGHYPTLFRYAEAMAEGPEFGSDNMRNILVNAVELAPQVGSIRLAAAHVLSSRGETDFAREMLVPILKSTHNPAAREAHELLGLLQRGERPTRQQLAQVFATR